ncbi:MAG: UDP-3-O-(3-hydroxymyristoyl)glucosamine N-acyltransferase [Bdellovibrionaceae bacterium]|nr:UDP-3-O-(3-hydroxymyristoyl)glucosamine N-acyltransferase [Pseudobdellovibrionaceae bacterium]
MEIRLSAIKEKFAQQLAFGEQLGADPIVRRIQAVEACEAGDLVFVDNKKFIPQALAKNPSAIVTHPKLAEAFPPRDGLGILVTPMVSLAHALIKSEYGDRDFINEQWPTRPESAVIHATAKVAKTAFISPNVVIGADAVVGERTRLQAGVVVENGAKIGDDCIIHANAVIGYNCELGNQVDIGPGTVIGSEGYGFGQNQKFQSFRIPQTGKVVIEDRVRLGASNCVDRASYGETRIGAGTKTDNLCHFAHGVQIGENCLLTSMFCIAGSSKVGNRVVASGQVGVIDHVNIADDVWLLHRAGVVKDIDAAGKYCALPLQTLEAYKANMDEVVKIAELAAQVRALQAKVDSL